MLFIASLLNPYLVEKKAEEIFAKLSPQERVLQVLVIGFNSPGFIKDIMKYGSPGGIIFFKKDRKYLEDYLDSIKKSCHIQPFFAVDQENGDVSPLPLTTPLPSPAMLGEIDNTTITEYTAYLTGTLAKRYGFNLVLAPVGDINTNPFNPVIGNRAFGSKFSRVLPHVLAFIRGLHEAGVFACVKHWPGHGNTGEDSHRVLPIAAHSTEEMEIFRLASLCGVDMIMVGHLLIPEWDTLPASLSPAALEILRRDCGEDVLVITDDICMRAIEYSPHTATRLAIKAGVDMVLISYTGNLKSFLSFLEKYYSEDRNFREKVDRAVRKILEFKIKNGIVEIPDEESYFARRTLKRGVVIRIEKPLYKKDIVFVTEDSKSKRPEFQGIKFIDASAVSDEKNRVYVVLYPGAQLLRKLSGFTRSRVVVVLSSPYISYEGECIITFQKNYPLELLIETLQEKGMLVD
ncbi:hypothetical protein DRQ18_01560 [bacterium]|nr:MAG: hypothetical protein DRQ18_01560 [bacterium]